MTSEAQNPEPTPDASDSPPLPGLFAGMVVTGDAEIIRGGEVVTDNSDEETR